MGWAAVGAAKGDAIGSGREALGYKKAGEHYAKIAAEAEPTRQKADPFAKYRQGQADYLNQLLTGEADFRTDPGYEFVRDEALRTTGRQSSATGNIMGSGGFHSAQAERAANLASTEYSKIIDRLTNIVGATGQNAVAGAQIYSDMFTTGEEGMAQAVVGKYTALGNRDRATHTMIGSIVDNGLAGGMSDIRLKTNLNLVGMDGPLHKYTWTWNKKAKELFGLEGQEEGYVAQEVQQYLPEAVGEQKGYLCLDYAYINERIEELELNG